VPWLLPTCYSDREILGLRAAQRSSSRTPWCHHRADKHGCSSQQLAPRTPPSDGLLLESNPESSDWCTTCESMGASLIPSVALAPCRCHRLAVPDRCGFRSAKPRGARVSQSPSASASSSVLPASNQSPNSSSFRSCSSSDSLPAAPAGSPMLAPMAVGGCCSASAR